MAFNLNNIQEERKDKLDKSKKQDIKNYDVIGNNLIRFFKSKFSAILISFILILLQTFHPAKVLLSFDLFKDYEYFNYFYCYILALSIEFFIIYYVLRSEEHKLLSMSMMFCVFSILINSYYYVDLLCISEQTFKFTYKLIPALLFACIIPVSLYRVSEEINKQI